MSNSLSQSEGDVIAYVSSIAGLVTIKHVQRYNHLDLYVYTSYVHCILHRSN